MAASPKIPPDLTVNSTFAAPAAPLSDMEAPEGPPAAFEPFRDPGDLRNLRVAGARHRCDWCARPFRVARANQRYCGDACRRAVRVFCASHGPALVPVLVRYARGRKADPESPQGAAFREARNFLDRRARALARGWGGKRRP